MRRLLVIFVGLFVPLGVHAQALSPWVDQVLTRIDAGIATANSMPVSGSCTRDVVISELENNLALAREKFSVTTHLADESQFLRERTICFQSDRVLLEEKMKSILTLLEDAATNCKQQGAAALRETYDFADEAYRSFLLGSVDPSYQDTLLRKKYRFESQEAMGSQQDPLDDPDSTAPLCPYTTDYAPHGIGYTPTSYGGGPTSDLDIKSFGCDATVLPTLAPSMQPEVTPLLTFMNNSDAFSRNIYDTVSSALSNIDSIIAVLTGKAPPDSISGTVPPPPHEEKTGCLRPLSPEDGNADPKELEYTMLAYPNYFDSQNLQEQEVAPGTTIRTYSPKPEETLPTWLLFRPLHDFFQMSPNQSILLRSYADRRGRAGRERPLPTYLSGTAYDTFSVQASQLDSEEVLRAIGGNIDRETAIIDTASRDAIELSAAAAKPLRDAVQSLTTVVDEYLPEEYIPSLTYFLLRDCVDGHCQQTLQSVTKRTFNPYCHPYVSGKYVEEDSFKRCYCDPSIQTEDPSFWDQYCSDDFGSNMSSYQAMQPELIPACVPYDEESSSKSTP